MAAVVVVAEAAGVLAGGDVVIVLKNFVEYCGVAELLGVPKTGRKAQKRSVSGYISFSVLLS